jgi:hypothetical protein
MQEGGEIGNLFGCVIESRHSSLRPAVKNHGPDLIAMLIVKNHGRANQVGRAPPGSLGTVAESAGGNKSLAAALDRRVGWRRRPELRNQGQGEEYRG